MNYNKKTVLDVDVSGKKVLLRCDFNVPQDKETGEITSDKRIVAALPTIRYLLDHGAAVIACSHLGKPEAKFDKWVKKQTEKGKDPATLTEEKWKKSLDKLTLAPVAKRLSELLGKDVIFARCTVYDQSDLFWIKSALFHQSGNTSNCLNTSSGAVAHKNDRINFWQNATADMLHSCFIVYDHVFVVRCQFLYLCLKQTIYKTVASFALCPAHDEHIIVIFFDQAAIHHDLCIVCF